MCGRFDGRIGDDHDGALYVSDDGALYASGFDQGAWRSLERGDTWTRIRGFNFKWGHRVIPDPADPTRVFITTFGGGVWHGPAAGDPDALEDVIEPARRK